MTERPIISGCTATHQDLVDRAVRWLNSRCNVVLSGIASTAEVPDAIGWSTWRPHRGSVVIECKTSLADFHRDKRKKHAANTMGHYRYFLCPAGLLSWELVAAAYPSHGLLWNMPRGVKVVGFALRRRTGINLDSEIRLLQFALLHVKSNLLAHGCGVDLCQLTKFFGKDGLILPEQNFALEASR